MPGAGPPLTTPCWHGINAGCHECGHPRTRPAPRYAPSSSRGSGRCAPGLRPAITHGLPSNRGMASSTFASGGVSGTMRGPDLASRSRNSFTVRSHVVPAQCQDFALAASRQHQQTQGRDRRWPHRAVRFRLAQHLPDRHPEPDRRHALHVIPQRSNALELHPGNPDRHSSRRLTARRLRLNR